MKRWIIISITVLLIIVVGGAGYLGLRSARVEARETPQAPATVTVTRGQVAQTVTAPGQVAGMDERLLSFAVDGQLAEITVRPGQVVQKGQELARLDPRPLEEALATARLELDQAEAQHGQDLAQAGLDLRIAEARLSQEKSGIPSLAAAEADVAAAQAKLQELLAGPGEDEITVAAAELRQAEVTLKQAQWAYDQVAYRDDIGASPEAVQLQEATLTYEAKLAAYNLAVQGPTAADEAASRAGVQQALAEVNRIRAEMGAREQELAILEAEVDKARLALEALQAGIDPGLRRAVETAETDLQAVTLTAPIDGVVLEVRVKPGETVRDRAGVVLLADTGAIEIRTSVIEEDLPLVQVGQDVEVFFDALPEEGVRGKVARIVPQRISGEDRPLYPVYISLAQLPSGVKAGMTADASIIIAQRNDVLRLPRTLVQAGPDNLAVVEVWVQGQVQRREVLAGLRGDVYVEIVAGLAEGEAVVGR